MDGDPAGGRRTGTVPTREEIVARITREQEELHPAPVYAHRARRQLRWYLVLIWPLGVVLGLMTARLVGWSVVEGAGLGVSLGLCFFYIGFVLLTERDDGRIDREVRRLRPPSGS